MRGVQVWILSCLCLLTGCVCETINCKRAYDPEGRIEGLYHIVSFTDSTKQPDCDRDRISITVVDSDCNHDDGEENRFESGPESIPLGISFCCKYIETDGTSATGFGVLPSALTLMIIPLHLEKEHWDCEVCVSSPVGKDTANFTLCVDQWCGSTPLGCVPAIWSDASHVVIGDSPSLVAERQREKLKKATLLAKEETVNAIKTIVSSRKYNDYIRRQRLAAEASRHNLEIQKAKRQKDAADQLAHKRSLAAKAEMEAKAATRERTLRDFALSEAPQLWQTIQTLKAEKATRGAVLAELCKEMKSFGRNPDADPDVVALRSAKSEIDQSLKAVYTKLEEAYIAYKKMQATPGRKEYADMMRAALEGGIQEADKTAARFKDMSRNK